jgi:hypothetical protein
MTQAIQKQDIQPSWSVQQIQDHLVKMIVEKIQTNIQLKEQGVIGDIDKLEKESAIQKAERFKKAGVKSPLELVKRLAELAVNMTGSKVSIAGTDTEATLLNEEPKVWLEAKKVLNEDEQKRMLTSFQSWMVDLGDAFGFKTNIDLANDGKTSKITFSKS